MTKKLEIELLTKAMLGHLFYDDYECASVSNLILDDVVEDIEETADEDFNDADVRIAICRVLMKRLGIEC